STSSVTGENTLSATGTLGTTTLTINYGANKPRIRNGSWIVDVTTDGGVVRGYFYRVVDATEDSTNTTFTLELQTSLKSVQASGATTFNIVVLENVVEVFDRGTGNAP